MKRVVIQQYRESVDRVRGMVAGLVVPPEGWVRTVRRAIGMSGVQLARRLGVTRAAVSNTEKAEVKGGGNAQGDAADG